MKGHTEKYLAATYCGEERDVWVYSSGGVLHTVKTVYLDGRTERRSFRGWPAARDYAIQQAKGN